MTPDQSFAKVDRAKATSLLNIFVSFLTPDVLTATWHSFEPEYWIYGSATHAGTFNGGKLSIKFLYVYFAVYIYICGKQDAPKESSRNQEPLRNSIRAAVAHFNALYPNKSIPSASILIRFWGRFYLPIEVWPAICKNFQDLLTQAGRSLAGDEKLLHFTGDSGYIRLVPTQPDRIGLSFFELVATLPNGDPYLVYTRFSNPNVDLGSNIPVSEAVKDSANVVKYFVDTKHCEPPVLVFDSYYTSADGRTYLNENGVKFIASVMTSRFINLMDNLAEHGTMVDKPGQTATIFNPSTNELFVHHWDVLASVGKKYVLSNAFERVPATSENAGIVPAYDQYKELFNACDKFNRKLQDRKFCHRSGGGARMGEAGHTMKFLMASILQNTFSAYKSCQDDDTFNLTFCDMCDLLSTQLVEHSFTYM